LSDRSFPSDSQINAIRDVFFLIGINKIGGIATNLEYDRVERSYGEGKYNCYLGFLKIGFMDYYGI